MPTIVNVDVRELSGVETGVDYSRAVVDFWPFRKAHIEDGGEDYLLSANILRVRVPDGETTVVLPPTPVGNALWVQERSFKGATKYLVSIPDQSEVNLWDLPHLDPDTLDPEAAPSPAWLAELITLQGELDATTETASDADAKATTALTAAGEATGAATNAQGIAVGADEKADTAIAALADKQDAATLDPTTAALFADDGSDLAVAVSAKIPTVADPLYAAVDLARASVLTQRERMAKGGTVGVGNKGVIVFRWDDWQDAFRTSILPLFVARGLVAGHALISRFQTAQPWGAGTTWADIQSWTKNGIEMWSHGTDHKDPTLDGDPGIYREIVTSRQEIEANNLKVMGFAPPGTTPLTAAQPFGTKWDSPASYNTYCGRLIQQTYGISDGYMAGSYRRLPHGLFHGINASSADLTDGGTKAAALAVIDKCVDRKLCATLFGHAGNIGKPGSMTLAEVTEVLDYVVTKRDAGLLEVLTPSAAYFASQDTDRRLELYRNGDWEGITTGDTRWAGWGTKTVQTSGGRTGANFLRILNTDTGAIGLTTDALGSDGLGVAGEVFMFEAWARCPEGNASVFELRAADSQDLTARPPIFRTKVISGTTWQKYMMPFSLYTTQKSISLQLRRVSGSSTSLDIDDVRVYKV